MEFRKMVTITLYAKQKRDTDVQKPQASEYR